jgi:hypothetical protein
VVLSSRQIVALWGSFSDVVTLPPRTRRRFLAAVGRLVDDEFVGRVRLPVRTPMYLARRRGGPRRRQKSGDPPCLPGAPAGPP